MQISVIMPVYNGAATLERTLQAFLRQEGVQAGEVELVLCDDGSRDGSWEILKRYEKLPQVRVLGQEHRGQSAATNRAALAARGEILLFAAQDVAPAGDRFVRSHLQAHRAGGGNRVVSGPIRFPAELLTTDFLVYLQESKHLFDFSAVPDSGEINPMQLYAPNFSAPRSWFLRLGGFDEAFPYGFQDTDLGIRCHLAGLNLILQPQLTVYHYHPQTLEQFAAKKRRFGRNFWDLYFKHEPFFRQIKTPWGQEVFTNLKAVAWMLLTKREVHARILQELHLCQDRDLEPSYDLYEEFSETVLPLEKLPEDRPARSFTCKYLFYSAIISYCYNQGLAARAVALGLWRPDGLDLQPLL